MPASIRQTFSPTDQQRRGVMFTISTVELVLAPVPAIVPAPPPWLEGCPVEMGATPVAMHGGGAHRASPGSC